MKTEFKGEKWSKIEVLFLKVPEEQKRKGQSGEREQFSVPVYLPFPLSLFLFFTHFDLFF